MTEWVQVLVTGEAVLPRGWLLWHWAGCGVVTSGCVQTEAALACWSIPSIHEAGPGHHPRHPGLGPGTLARWYTGTRYTPFISDTLSRCPAQTSTIWCCMMEKSAYLDIYTSTSILFPIAKHGSWNKAVGWWRVPIYVYSINKEFYNVPNDFYRTRPYLSTYLAHITVWRK